MAKEEANASLSAPPPLVARQSSIDPLNVTLEFSGGAELLVGKQKTHQAKLPQLVCALVFRC